jgi:hypothetical protein
MDKTVIVGAVARNKKEIKMIMTSREEGEQNDKENKH